MATSVEHTAAAGVAKELAGAVLTIDLDAIRDNYRTLKRQLGGVECAGVVKADGYGLGAPAIAAALHAEGCRSFFIAHIEEAIRLRAALGDGDRLYVLNGLPPGAESACAEAGVTPVLNSLAQIEAWAGLAARRGRQLACALQVDSGMSRMGLSPSETERLAASPALLQALQVDLVMSHLACADEPDHPANLLQREAFDRLRRLLPEAPASLANSSGIFLGGGFHYDLARPGAALYGINPTPGRPNPMRQVVRLQAEVVQTREVGDGIGIGYGHAARARAGMRLATISIGYADGWPRCASGAAFYRGVRLPFAGRVSMDTVILDITPLPAGALQPGHLVDLFCPEQTVDDVAEIAGTIGYEILTGLGARFHRRYVRG